MTTLIEVLKALDPAVDADWTQGGEPLLSVVSSLVGESVSREDVDALTGGMKRDAWDATKIAENGDANIGSTTTQVTQVPTPGRIVTVTVPAPGIEGVLTIAALVAFVADDGTINARGFAPKGGADPFFTGLHDKGYIDALPEGDAGRNVPYWDWPARV